MKRKRMCDVFKNVTDKDASLQTHNNRIALNLTESTLNTDKVNSKIRSKISTKA